MRGSQILKSKAIYMRECDGVSSTHRPSDKDDFCNSTEFLLFVDQADCQYVHEADLLPTSLCDAINACEDTTIQIIRMDHSNWCGEDVTEDIASAWLDVHAPELTTEHTLPEFVADSDAWQQYRENFELIYGRPK